MCKLICKLFILYMYIQCTNFYIHNKKILIKSVKLIKSNQQLCVHTLYRFFIKTLSAFCSTYDESKEKETLSHAFKLIILPRSCGICSNSDVNNETRWMGRLFYSQSYKTSRRTRIDIICVCVYACREDTVQSQ